MGLVIWLKQAWLAEGSRDIRLYWDADMEERVLFKEKVSGDDDCQKVLLYGMDGDAEIIDRDGNRTAPEA
jgi:hypothetical protein